MSDTTNSDLLTNAATLLERYRIEERELELSLSEQQIRLQGVREVIAALSGKRLARGRPRKTWPVVVTAEPEPEHEPAA